MLYLNKLEGFKSAVKNIHWSSKKLPEHEYMDDLAELLANHQDYIAEIAQGIFGKIKNNELKGIKYTIKTPNKLLKDILKSSETFYNTIQKSKHYIGMRSVMEDFIAELNKSAYILDMALIESIINNKLSIIKENKGGKLQLTENTLNQLIKETIEETLNEIGDTNYGQYMLGRLTRRKFIDGAQNDSSDEIRGYAEKQRGQMNDVDKSDRNVAFNKGEKQQGDFMRNVKNAELDGEMNPGDVGYARAKSSADTIRRHANDYYDETPWRKKELKRQKEKENRTKFRLDRFS